MNTLLQKLFLLIALMAPVSFAAEVDPPLPLEVTGVVVSHSEKIKSSAIINDRIWWEGQTIRVRKPDDSWVTLTLIKVEMVRGKGGVVTFQIEQVAEIPEESEPQTFQVQIKKSTRWGLHR